MGIVIKESIKSTIASYVGVAIGTINVVFLYTRFFTPEQLGLTRVLQDTTLLFVSFAQLGIPFIIIKYFPFFQDKDKNHSGFLFFTLFYSLISLFIFTILFVLLHSTLVDIYTTKSPMIVDYLYFIIPYVFAFVLMSVFESYIIVNSKVFFTTFIREIFIKLSNTLLIILYSFSIITFSEFITFLITAYFVASLLLLIYLKKLGNFSFRPNLSILRSRMLKKMFNYGFYTVLGGIGYFLSTKIDIVMLPAYEGLKQTAIYTIAVLIATLMEIPKRSLTQAVTSHLSFAMKENDKNKIEYLYKKTSINLFLFGSILFILLWININDLYSFIPNGEIYIAGKMILLLFLLMRLVDLLSGINSEIILYSKYYKYSFYFMVVLGILTVITNLIFIPLYGILGAAIATLVSLIIYSLLRIIFVWIKFKIHPFDNQTLKIISVFLVFIFSSVLVNDSFSKFLLNIFTFSNHIFSTSILIIIKSIILISLFSLVVTKLKISDEFNNLVLLMIRKIKDII